MKIGILGSGVVGQVLATAFLKEGNAVMLASRNTTKDAIVKWQKDNSGGQIGSYNNAAKFADIIILATGGAVVEEVIKSAGIENFSGKTVIDVTNPIAAEPPVNGVLKYFTTPNESLMEKLQVLLPQAHLVKAFNSVGNAFMYKPDFDGIKPSMFICGNDDEAKKTVTNILISFGWEVEDMGKVEAARAIEPLCMLWCIPGLRNNQWSHAFKLLKK
ncbi:MAG TPA: NAD(P)-binding domain-containing protein [Ferruginibacter sp.]|nr:NAD(P)-binding domain-containing protein [Ferruginibacter sp.]